jgi:hypothetical protein
MVRSKKQRGRHNFLRTIHRSPWDTPGRRLAFSKRLKGWKSLKGLAPQVGLEPTTLRLTAECSTIELLRSKAGRLASTSLHQTSRTLSNRSCLLSRQSRNVAFGLGISGMHVNLRLPVERRRAMLASNPIKE